MRLTMSIYSVLGVVGTYSEDEQDYRLFCPDERYQLFHDASTDLARSIKQMSHLRCVLACKYAKQASVAALTYRVNSVVLVLRS